MDEPDPLLGTVVAARYRLMRVLGEGGMGVVYEAVQEELERTVAVKVMRPEYASDRSTVERFLREARAAGGIDHPNIVDIYDVGRLADGRPYMVMPRLDGQDLAAHLEETAESLSIERVVELLEGPAAALDLIHARGMVHRDLKPENLVHVRLANGQEVVKLVDFGLAALLDQPASRLTRAGTVTGTPQYMSPESADGALPDGRGDVYALAVITFELLTKQLPFDGVSPLLTLRRKTEEVAPTLREYGVHASPALEAVIARGLERDPERRYRTAGALVAALRAAADAGLETDPADDLEVDLQVDLGTDDDLESVGTRSPRTWWITGAVVLVLGGLSAAYAWPTSSEVEAPSSSREPVAIPRGEPEAELTRSPIEVPDAPAPRAAEPPTAVAPEVPENPERALEPEPSVAPRRSRARRDATAPVLAGSPASGPPPSPPPADVDGARALVDEGTAALTRGRVPEAIELFRRASLLAPRYPPAWRGLGLAEERLGRHAEARRAYRRYLQLAPGAADAAVLRARVERLEAE